MSFSSLLLLGYWFILSRLHGRLGKIDIVNGSGRTFEYALAAELALGEVYIGHIVLHGDGIVGTNLGAFSATYAGSLAGLSGHGTLVLVDAGNIDAHISRSLVPDFNDALGTSFGTGTAGCTFLLVNHRKSGFRIHLDCSEGTGSDTIATAQTAVAAGSVPGIEGSLHAAGLHSVIA